MYGKKIARTLLAATALLALHTANAATIEIKAKLDAASEVPAKDSAGKGTLTATYDTETSEFKYHIEFEGLTGAAVAAHFHGPAAEGANAKPQIPIKATPLASPIDGKATLTPEQAKDLLDGKWYLNVHTAANPGGEIRGQVLKAN